MNSTKLPPSRVARFDLSANVSTSTSRSRSQAPVEPRCWEQSISATGLISKGVLVRQGDRWASTGECTVVDVPPTLHGLLLSRVDRLPADVRRLLQEMAVLGAVFEETLLCDVATDPSAIEGVLSRLTEADLIQPAGQGPESKRFRFTHTLVHEVVYQNLPPLA
jgi:predicted ATPase